MYLSLNLSTSLGEFPFGTPDLEKEIRQNVPPWLILGPHFLCTSLQSNTHLLVLNTVHSVSITF